MAIDEKVLKKNKKLEKEEELKKTLGFLEQGLENTKKVLKIGKNAMNKAGANINEINQKQGKGPAGSRVFESNAKDGKKTDFGMLSVKKGIDKNPKPTQADRIAGATMKDGSRTKVRGVRIANKGFRKAKLS